VKDHILGVPPKVLESSLLDLVLPPEIEIDAHDAGVEVRRGRVESEGTVGSNPMARPHGANPAILHGIEAHAVGLPIVELREVVQDQNVAVEPNDARHLRGKLAPHRESVVGRRRDVTPERQSAKPRPIGGVPFQPDALSGAPPNPLPIALTDTTVEHVRDEVATGAKVGRGGPEHDPEGKRPVAICGTPDDDGRNHRIKTLVGDDVGCTR